MAQRTIVQLVSDLSGDEMQAGEGRTVEFAVDGTSYTIDLTDKEAAGFDKALAMYVEHATKTNAGNAGGAVLPGSQLHRAKTASWPAIHSSRSAGFSEASATSSRSVRVANTKASGPHWPSAVSNSRPPSTFTLRVR